MATDIRPSATPDANGVSNANGNTPEASTNTPQEATPKQGFCMNHFQHTLVPIFLIATCPNAVILLWYTAVRCKGSFLLLGQKLMSRGVLTGLIDIWGQVNFFSPLALAVLFLYCIFAIILHLWLPGPRAYGPLTPKGNRPIYKDNGFKCYLVTMLSFAVLTVCLKSYGLSPTIIYYHYQDFLGTLTVVSMIGCVLLYFKGLCCPTTRDNGSSGNPIFDYYWGTELYPRICGVDIKVFTNCRFGMTVWGLLVLIFTMKSYELHGFVDSAFVSCFLHFVYFTKFFWWESGYMSTIDIMVDRAGYYICWGCMVFIPGVYACTSLYLVTHPVQLGVPLSLLIVAIGTAATVVNYLADLQKQQVRRTGGNCKIWGWTPIILKAKYRIDSGEQRTSLLLASGWWGVSRHFHYVPELILAFMWCLPGLFENVMCYTYFLWLVVLLTHRTYRDDTKCRAKYGEVWDAYCRLVPYKMIPHIF